VNLFDMYSRKDRAARFSAEITQHKLSLGADQWRGLVIPNGARIVVPQAMLFHPVRERPATCGWAAKTFMGQDSALHIAFMAGSSVVSSIRLKLGEALSDVPLPWPAEGSVDEAADLVVEAHSPDGAVFLGVSRGLDRRPLIARAQGHGIEIGPGLHPQIKPQADNLVESVLYVEQQSADDWRALYAGKQEIDRSLWDDYRQGTADKLPVDDDSLDFIFSSHVFEHLANPIGHLRHWGRKLKAGGLVLAIVPELGGAKDYRQHASSLAELLEEDTLGLWEPGRHHYERYVRNTISTANAEAWLQEKRSIHVHFYTPESVSDVLRHACERLGFARFDVLSTPNQKEFHFVLEKAP